MTDVWSYFLEFRDERFKLEGRDLTVGRSRACDVAIKDPSVSRRHVQLTPRSGKVVLTDLGSSNGTFINGERISGNGELADGDALGLGDADLRVRIVPKAAFETLRMPQTAMPENPPGVAAPDAAPEGSGSQLPEAGGAPAEGASFAEAQGASDVRDDLPEVGEATGILQAESMRLASEALRDTLEESGAQAPAPGAPGAHVAPPSPASFAGPTVPAEPSSDVPEDQGPAWTTQVLPTVIPPEPTIELPEEPGAPEAEPPVLEPRFTQPIPTIPPSPPIEDPKMTQPLPAAPVPASAEAPETAPSDPPPPVESPRVTQPLPAIDPPVFEEDPKMTRPIPAIAPPPRPGGAVSSQPVRDIREATLPSEPPAEQALAPEESPGSDELLPSLEGFDTTLGPGVPLPESMQRARESMSQRRASSEDAPVASAYVQPGLQAPPLAGFWIRAAAALLDGVWSAALGVLGWFALGQLGSIVAGGVAIVVVLGGWTIWGTTPGKRTLGLYLYTADGQAGLGLGRAALRFVAYLLSLLPLGIGFLMVLSSKRGLHDRIAGTYVRHYR